MGKKTYEPDSDSDMEDGGAKLNAPTDDVAKSTDAMDVDVPPTPADKKQAAAAARAERAARRKQRREELTAQGGSRISSIASTPNPDSEPASPTKTSQEKKSRRKKTEKKSPKKADNTEKAEEEAGETPAAETATPSEPTVAATAPASAPATDAEPLPFAVDVKPTKPKATNVTSTSVAGDTTSNAPSSVSGVDSQHQGLNRAARRRLMQIENRRLAIKKELGIEDDSDDRQAEVNALLAAWTAQFDEKAEARAAKKAAKKDSSRSKAKGKLLTGHNTNDYEKQKQIKKQKRKEALRARQEGS
ncbi:hypothetical protein ColLi_11000 [Colletotrichum liriopes]|uniref:Uncharacterized protein n=1 Tax=Colletotrichum liriopes TaxID=708192 RepID=A0AA37GW82_9PEZI|nr:hypothetical protein ColLi_11000 [Colletotrichum liriopes]